MSRHHRLSKFIFELRLNFQIEISFCHEIEAIRFNVKISLYNRFNLFNLTNVSTNYNLHLQCYHYQKYGTRWLKLCKL